MRANQQSRDVNLALVLISTVLMFLCCHTPRYTARPANQISSQLQNIFSNFPSLSNILLLNKSSRVQSRAWEGKATYTERLLFISLSRLITSIYEAANIHSILHCRDKKKDKTPLWFMYITATVQFLMVNKLNLRPQAYVLPFVGCQCIL